MKNPVFPHEYDIGEHLRIRMCPHLWSIKIYTRSWASHLTFLSINFLIWPYCTLCSFIDLPFVLLIRPEVGTGEKGNDKTEEVRKDNSACQNEDQWLPGVFGQADYKMESLEDLKVL